MLGFKGLFAGIIFSELVTFVLLNILRMILQALGKVGGKGFMAIPEQNEGEICDFTVTGSDENAVNVSEKIIEYCRSEKLPEDKAKALGIATEELIANIGRYGYKEQENKYIDVCLSKTDDKYYLRLRDDGIPFDPTAYNPPEHEKYEIGGLELIRKLSLKITYMRVISLNNTVIELNPVAEGGSGHE